MIKLNKLGIIAATTAVLLISCTNQNNTKENSTSNEQTEVATTTSENSSAWVGVYEGTTPCADCPGIETKVELKEDNTFTATFNYLGEGDKAQSYTKEGSFTWDESKEIITLKAEDETSQYKVGENTITLLDAEGNVNTGELADLYVLRKKM